MFKIPILAASLRKKHPIEPGSITVSEGSIDRFRLLHLSLGCEEELKDHVG